MKRWRKFKNDEEASLTAYTMLLFGMIVMLYLFGFSSMWDVYTGTDEGSVVITEGVTENPETDNPEYEEREFDLTNPLNFGFVIFDIMLSSIYTTLIGAAAIVGTLVLVVFFRNNQAIWQFIIPIILLIVLNIFVFPISALQGDMAPMDAVFADTAGFSFTLILIIFFNLFYILAVLEFVRGGGST